MKRRLALLCIVFAAAACGDDVDDKGTNIISGNNGTSNNATTNNATTSNATTSNATTNNSGGPGIGTAAELLAETTDGQQPSDRPCRATSVLSFGTDSFESIERYGYDDQGRLQLVDTFEEATWISREVRRYQDGELFREISVDAEQELTDLVTTVSYDAGRPVEVELATPDMMGVLNPPVETIEYAFESDESWSITTLDDQGNVVGTDTASWDATALTFDQIFDDGSSSSLTFESAPRVESLHRIRFIEPFAVGAPIAGGSGDEDGDGEADSTVSTTYDGEQIQTYEVEVTGGGTITISFDYACDS